ncbi:hypothetical protein E4K10_49060 [Streptomyces sp. T1317-0309]|nr:hypothetical protein E4K10_49060 [Streptomyces sp. T1317-0309]
MTEAVRRLYAQAGQRSGLPTASCSRWPCWKNKRVCSFEPRPREREMTPPRPQGRRSRERPSADHLQQVGHGHIVTEGWWVPSRPNTPAFSTR